MAIDANSYGSVAGVAALTPHMLNGEATFEGGRPNIEEVERFIDEQSAVLNDAISACGFSVPISTAGPKKSCDAWVVAKSAAMVELTQRSAGFDGDQNSRYASLWNLYPDAFTFVTQRKEAWTEQGVSLANDASDALTYTALEKHSERTDPDSTTKEQPRFRRRQFLS